MNKISMRELLDAVNMYIDAKEGVYNIYTEADIKSVDDIIDIYLEDAHDIKRNDIVILWSHMIKWDCQRHKQTRSWFTSMMKAFNVLKKSDIVIKRRGTKYNDYINLKNDIYNDSLKAAYDDCSSTSYMTKMVPMTLPSEYDLIKICFGNNLINWIRERAENDEVFNIKELSDLIPPKEKSIPEIPVKKAFSYKFGK